MEPYQEAFAATEDDRGDVWMAVSSEHDLPSILWLKREADGPRFSLERRVQHPAVVKRSLIARAGAAMLVLLDARVAIVPFAALRVLPAIGAAATASPLRRPTL